MQNLLGLMLNIYACMKNLNSIVKSQWYSYNFYAKTQKTEFSQTNIFSTLFSLASRLIKTTEIDDMWL